MLRFPPAAVTAPLAFAAALLAPSPAVPEVRTVNDGNVVLDGVPEIPPEIGRQLRRYQNTRAASVQDWTADGRGLYVTTRFGEVAQLHRVAMPGGARTQLTFFDEPVGGVARRPGGGDLLFFMDAGGNEFRQIFLLDPATGDSRLLSDGESRNGAAVWSRDGARLAYQSTRRNGRSNDVWTMDPADPTSARLVLEAPDGAWWAPADWSADGRRLLIQQYVSASRSAVHLLDLATGTRTVIAGGGEEPEAWLGVTPRFDATGERVFVATDRGGEFTRLGRLDLATGGLELVTSAIPWDVDDLALSPDRTRAAFTVNAGGLDRLYLLDPATLAHAEVTAVPTGLVGSLEFSPDGRRLAMHLNTTRTPSDAFVLELGESPTDAGELVRWTFSEVGGLDTDTFVGAELVHYPTFDEVDGERRRIPAFLYLPPGEGPHPVVVYIHGGPESQHRPSFRANLQLWARELGMAVVAPNVRGSSGYGKRYLALDNGFLREDSVKDIGALLDWIDARPDLDGRRVAVYGGSYGGYMVLASLVHYSDRLRAGVDIVGISNFVTFLENTQDYRRDLRRVEYGDERDPEMRAHLEKISPNNNAERITAPLFVAQGQNDPRVPVTESEQIVRDVRAAGYDVWYMNALNEGHGFRKKENRDLYQEIVALFWKTHLLGDDG